MLYRLTLFAQRLSALLPQRVRWWVGASIAQAIYWVWAEKRRATQHNMGIVLGRPPTDPLVREVARLSWRNYGHYLGDLFDIPNHRPIYYLENVQDDTPVPPAPDGTIGAFVQLDTALARGRGVMVVTGHYGNYDAAGMLVAAHTPIHALAEHLKDPRMDEWLQSQRREAGITIVYTEDLLRPIIQLFRSGGVLATPMDRPVPPSEGIPVQFFGRTAYVPRGLGALAAKTGAAICPGFVYYGSDGGLRVRVFPPTTIEKSGDSTSDVLRATQVMYDALEVMIREDPTQWYMFRPFWPMQEIPAVRTPQTVASHAAKAGRDD